MQERVNKASIETGENKQKLAQGSLERIRTHSTLVGLGQTDSVLSNIVAYKFVVRICDGNQTLFNTIQHPFESLNSIQQGSQSVQLSEFDNVERC